MKKFKNVILILSLLCSTVPMSTISAAPAARTKAESSLKNRKIFYYYSSYYNVYITFNPSTERIIGVSYRTEANGEEKYAQYFDTTGAGISYVKNTQTLTLTNYEVILGGGLMGLSDVLTRVDI